jgi:(4S)-4-hydroxy-5-phosphonooxypentane-2,3-dione isomerase
LLFAQEARRQRSAGPGFAAVSAKIGGAMHVIHVHVHVKPESVEAFRQATATNASESVREPGVARFDVIQQQDDPTRFVLVEVYRTAAAIAAHKETAHYATWRDTVAPLMAEPRWSVKYAPVFPADPPAGA